MDEQLEKLIATHAADVHRAPPHVVAQWHDAIDNAAALERGRSRDSALRWHPASFFWGIVVTAALVFGIGIGFFLSGDDIALNEIGSPQVASVGGDGRYSTAAFSRGLQVHLRDSRAQLSSLDKNANRTVLILRIIEQNQLFETAAERNDAPQLARLLRAFEPILLQLAAADIAPEDAEALRARLAFEFNVMLTKLAHDASDESQTT